MMNFKSSCTFPTCIFLLWDKLLTAGSSMLIFLSWQNLISTSSMSSTTCMGWYNFFYLEEHPIYDELVKKFCRFATIHDNNVTSIVLGRWVLINTLINILEYGLKLKHGWETTKLDMHFGWEATRTWLGSHLLLFFLKWICVLVICQLTTDEGVEHKKIFKIHSGQLRIQKLPLMEAI